MAMVPNQPSTTTSATVRWEQLAFSARPDELAIEEPLEIRVAHGARSARQVTTIAVTMRTPGEDFDLALGFLFTEGLLRDGDDVEGVVFCGASAEGWRNVVRIELQPRARFESRPAERNSYISSSCGVCGKTSIAAVRTACPWAIASPITVAPELLCELPHKLRAQQAVFDRTGGLHAAALFNEHGELMAVREDVGRHNAVDKLIGSRLYAGALPLSDCILLVSGRASFELVQKAAMAGIPVLTAVGAPSSLAVRLARETGMTLAGFVRNGRLNLYSGEQRVQGAAAAPSHRTAA